MYQSRASDVLAWRTSHLEHALFVKGTFYQIILSTFVCKLSLKHSSNSPPSKLWRKQPDLYHPVVCLLPQTYRLLKPLATISRKPFPVISIPQLFILSFIFLFPFHLPLFSSSFPIAHSDRVSVLSLIRFNCKLAWTHDMDFKFKQVKTQKHIVLIASDNTCWFPS